MLREIKSTQRKVRTLLFRVTGATVAGGTLTKNGLTEGAQDALITENASGDYTITFNQAFARTPVCQCTTATDVSTMRIVSVSTTAVRVEQVGADQTTGLADGDFHLSVFGFDAVDAT